jgi:hypothetical protein
MSWRWQRQGTASAHMNAILVRPAIPSISRIAWANASVSMKSA